MFTFKELLNYSKLNLTANEILILHILKSIPPPVKLDSILKNYNINVKRRQFFYILNNLELYNQFARVQTNNGIIFAFPYLLNKNIIYHRPRNRKCIALHYKKCNLLHLINHNINTSAINCTSSYLYNVYNKYKRNYNVISKSINNNYILEEDYTLYNIKNKHNEHSVNYNNPLCNKTNIECEFVVDKNNYLLIKNIKERFKIDFPNKNAYINCPLPKEFNYATLKEKINKSQFLKEKTNLGLNWMLKNYNAIINNFYEDKVNMFYDNYNFNPSKPDFSQREYSKEYLNSFFDTLEDIEV